MLESSELETLKGFLAQHVEDLEELVILAELEARGAEPSTLASLDGRVPLPLETTRAVLAKLAARALVVCSVLEPAEYRFEPPEGLREPFGRVLAHYRADPLAVLMLLSSNAIERVRNAALYTFADAFRIGGPKSNG